MLATRVFHYRDPAAVYLGLNQLRKAGLTPRGILFLALDPRGETYIAVPEDMDVVTELRVGDKLALEPPWQGRYFHFDAIHRLPGDTTLWNGDRRLADAGSAAEVATGVAEWLRGASAKNLFLGCTPHQPGSWWMQSDRDPVTALHARGFVNAVVATSGLIASRIGEATLYHLAWRDLAQTGALAAWTPVFASPLGNILMVERRILNYRLVLSCQRGLVEIDVSGLPETATQTEAIELATGLGVVGRVDGGAFAVTSGTIEDWGLANVRPALLVGGPNQTLADLPRALRGLRLDSEG
jgi:hypothetical protein